MSQLETRHDDGMSFPAPRLAALPELVAVELIRQALVKLGCGEQNLTQDHYGAILDLARSPAARVLTLPGRFIACREGEEVVLSRPASRARRVGRALPSSEPVVLQIPGETWFAGRRIEARILDATELKTAQIKGDKSPFCEYLDLDRVRPPVIARRRRAGDRFRPLGFDTEKKLGKFLTAAKVSREVREHIMVVEDQEHIIWVCPVRLSEPAKVTAETRRVLVLTVA